MKECYHKECDDLTKVTPEKLEYLAKITEMLARYELEISTEQSAGACGGNPQENWDLGTFSSGYVFRQSRSNIAYCIIKYTIWWPRGKKYLHGEIEFMFC